MSGLSFNFNIGYNLTIIRNQHSLAPTSLAEKRVDGKFSLNIRANNLDSIRIARIYSEDSYFPTSNTKLGFSFLSIGNHEHKDKEWWWV